MNDVGFNLCLNQFLIKYFKTHSIYMYTSISYYYIFFVKSISRKFREIGFTHFEHNLEHCET